MSGGRVSIKAQLLGPAILIPNTRSRRTRAGSSDSCMHVPSRSHRSSKSTSRGSTEVRCRRFYGADSQ